MRRNWDTIRSVLLAVEAGYLHPSRPVMLSLGDTMSAPHLRMLMDQGYVRTVLDGFLLSSLGHDLLDAIRDDRVWDCCRRAIALNAGGLPTDLLLGVARRAIESLARQG